jgi:hypothetical protein
MACVGETTSSHHSQLDGYVDLLRHLLQQNVEIVDRGRIEEGRVDFRGLDSGPRGRLVSGVRGGSAVYSRL